MRMGRLSFAMENYLEAMFKLSDAENGKGAYLTHCAQTFRNERDGKRGYAVFG
ncbi:MAG: hypothetical protein LBU32_22690 [Clostridiales bacterium]|nr:hypothetical protein [Clostridiales bacterium]